MSNVAIGVDRVERETCSMKLKIKKNYIKNITDDSAFLPIQYAAMTLYSLPTLQCTFSLYRMCHEAKTPDF